MSKGLQYIYNFLNTNLYLETVFEFVKNFFFSVELHKFYETLILPILLQNHYQDEKEC